MLALAEKLKKIFKKLPSYIVDKLDEWIEAVGMIKPDIVHLYTLDRVPAVSGLVKTDEDTLYTIAAKLEKRTRIKSKVFY